MGAHDFKLNKVPLFARKPENINTSMSAAPKLAGHTAMYVPSFIRIERGSDGAHDFKYNKVPRFALKSVDIKFRCLLPRT